MRILYGVQGTGNGHITRARCMAEELQRLNVQVDYVFSGRDRCNYFDMEIFGDARYFHGLSFATKNNKIDHLATITQTHPLRFFKELKQINIEGYDLIISDFEPLTAWRSRFSSIPTLGIGHQYSFLSGAPWPKYDLVGRAVLRFFAPTKKHLGMHWHHFNGTILPPMIDVSLRHNDYRKDKTDFVLVYLPFEDSNEAIKVLEQLPDINFNFYSPQHKIEQQHKNIKCKPLSKPDFKRDLQICTRLISSCGFGLVSEALHLGIPILTIPVKGQGEQIANAIALTQLGYGILCRTLNVTDVKTFIEDSSLKNNTKPMNYPNVAKEVARFCADGAINSPHYLVDRLWNIDSRQQQLQNEI